MADSTQSMSEDEERFERLFRAHVGAVRRYALRRDPAGAEDVVSEVFLVAWRRLDDVPPDGELPIRAARADRAGPIRRELKINCGGSIRAPTG